MIEKYFDINADGNSIKAKIYCKEISLIKEVTIYCHGFGGNKENKSTKRFAERLIGKNKHMAILAIDFPCHGNDVKKKLTLEDCLNYLTLTIQYIKDRYHTDTIYSYSNSMGSYVVLCYIHQYGNPFKKIILRCPALHMYESLSHKVETLPDYDKYLKGKEIQIDDESKIKITKAFMDELEANDVRNFDYIDYADQILLVQGTKDEIIDFDIVNEFSENNVIELIPIENADHRFRDSNLLDLAISEMIKFIERS